MHADEAAAGLHPLLEGLAPRGAFLVGRGLDLGCGVLGHGGGHDVPCRAHEGHDTVAGQILGSEDRGVLGEVDLQAEGLELLLQELIAHRDGVLVTEARGLGEDERTVGFGGEGDGGDEQGEEGAHGDWNRDRGRGRDRGRRG